MTNNKVTIEQAKQQISEGFSSVMTREDVLHLLDCLEIPSTNKFELSSDQLKQLSSDIVNEIESEGTSIIDDYELTMNYKEVELDSVEFNSSRMEDVIKDTIEQYIDNISDDTE
jgi:hypothetical protein